MLGSDEQPSPQTIEEEYIDKMFQLKIKSIFLCDWFFICI